MLRAAACVLPVAHLSSPNHLLVAPREFLRSLTLGCRDDVIVHYSPKPSTYQLKIDVRFPADWTVLLGVRGRDGGQISRHRTLLYGIESRPIEAKQKISPVYC